ncbi:MAG: EAL domain-containing protein [Actinomycetota bacterium]|nr:EAL domain-containing protein [Actinomycetota bacterium]
MEEPSLADHRGATAPVGPPATARAPGRVTAVLVLLAGLLASAAVGTWWADDVREDEAMAREHRAEEIARTVASTIRRHVDVTVAALNILRVEPAEGADIEPFRAWYELEDAGGRHPGTVMLGYIRAVTAEDAPAAFDELAAGLTAGYAVEEDAFRSAFGDDLGLEPGRDRYCIPTVLAGDLAVWGALGADRGVIDQCQTPVGGAIDQARDTGRVAFVPWGLDDHLLVVAPHYGEGDAPASLDARRSAFVGAMFSVIDGRTLLDTATGSRNDLRLELTEVHMSGERALLATTGGATGGTPLRDVTFFADGTWRLGVTQLGGPASPSPDVQGWAVFVAGAAASLMLAALLRTASVSRERALALVDVRTGELHHQALHDALTGLANRSLVTDRAEHLLRRARRDDDECAALVIGLDGFKTINETLGHEQGDALLRSVGARLARTLRESDTVGRMGGDEFVVLLEQGAIEPGPEVVADRILDVLREPFPVGGVGADGDADRDFPITASVGVAVRRSGTASELLRDADIALHQAKAEGRNRAVVFRPEMQAAAHERLTLSLELRDAIGHGQLHLDYQPTFDIASMRVTGVEALLRWRHPVRGPVSPLEFIPLAEQSGIIVDIGAWVLREACGQMAIWHAHGHDLRLHVNVSGHQLERDDFVTTVAGALASTALPARNLVLEITESMLMHDAVAVGARLAELKALGVQLAIDDFGTGYSSLSYLRQFPVDSIKIDRSFLTDIAHSTEAAALLHSLIRLGRSLGLETLAEGIEEEAQLDHLRREACDSGQGYLVSRPLPPGEVEHLFTPSQVPG